MTITDLRRAVFRFMHRTALRPTHCVLHPEDWCSVVESCNYETSIDFQTGDVKIIGLKVDKCPDVTRGMVNFVLSINAL